MPNDDETLLTLKEIQGFFGDARPSKKEIEKWITKGTAEGVFLDAAIIDGRYYVRRAAFARFIEISRAARAEIPSEPRPTRATRNRAVESLERLRRLGVKF